ncbi:hypothetical protein ACOME3_002702 [Neoechinorhynchus agilis]
MSSGPSDSHQPDTRNMMYEYTSLSVSDELHHPPQATASGQDEEDDDRYRPSTGATYSSSSPPPPQPPQPPPQPPLTGDDVVDSLHSRSCDGSWQDQGAASSTMPRYRPYPQGGAAPHIPSRILFIRIENDLYPVPVDTIRQICSPFGLVLRIRLIHKNPSSPPIALVEFDSIASSTDAMNSLQGADIYAGCCTLRIEYSQTPQVKVRNGDPDCYEAREVRERPPQRQGLLPTPTTMPPRKPSSPIQDERGAFPPPPQLPHHHHQQQHLTDQNEQFDRRYDLHPSHMSYRHPFPPPPPQGGRTRPSPTPRGIRSYEEDRNGVGRRYTRSSRYEDPAYDSPPVVSHHVNRREPMGPHTVLLLNNLNNEHMTCKRLFNLFCLYGNVYGVKFLASRAGCAMVEIDNIDLVSKFMRPISNTFIFGQRISVAYSRQEVVEPVHKTFTMSDGSPSYFDFSTDRSNRYQNEHSASKNRPVPPTKTLYYYNMPPDTNENDVFKVFDDAGAKRPIRLKQFPPRVRDHSSQKPMPLSGLAEWENIDDATTSLVLANNTPVSSPQSTWPYVFKLAFSTSTIIGPGVSSDVEPLSSRIQDGPQESRKRSYREESEEDQYEQPKRPMYSRRRENDHHRSGGHLAGGGSSGGGSYRFMRGDTYRGMGGGGIRRGHGHNGGRDIERFRSSDDPRAVDQYGLFQSDYTDPMNSADYYDQGNDELDAYPIAGDDQVEDKERRQDDDMEDDH